MANSALFGTSTKVSSPGCIDGYGLSLIAVHLFGSLCHRQNQYKDILCEIGKRFMFIMHYLQNEAVVYKYKRNATRFSFALDQTFRQRSRVITHGYQKLKELLNKDNSHKIAMTQYKILKLLSTHLVRRKLTEGNQHQYLRSKPSSCVTWRNWRTQLCNINVNSNL